MKFSVLVIAGFLAASTNGAPGGFFDGLSSQPGLFASISSAISQEAPKAAIDEVAGTFNNGADSNSILGPGVPSPFDKAGSLPPGFGPELAPWAGMEGVPFPLNVIWSAFLIDAAKGCDFKNFDLLKCGRIFSPQGFEEMQKMFTKEQILKTTRAVVQEFLAITTEILKNINQGGSFDKQFGEILDPINRKTDVQKLV